MSEMCIICGDKIDEQSGEVPCYMDAEMSEKTGDYDGRAYHLNKCESEIFAEVYARVKQ